MADDLADLADDYLLWAMEFVCAAGFDPSRLTPLQLGVSITGTELEAALLGEDGEVVRLEVRDGCLCVVTNAGDGREVVSRAFRCPDAMPVAR